MQLKILRAQAVKGKLYKDIMKLAWPSITEQTLIMMVGIVSTIFVGRIGKEAMAAVGMINMLVFFLQTVFAGLSTGTTVVIARVMGEGDRNKAKTALIQSLFMCTAAGFLITGFGYIFSTPILRVFLGSAGQEVFSIGLTYYRIVMFGLFFMVFDIVIAGAVRGAGDTRTPMYITGIVNIINVVLCSILIFGVQFRGVQVIPAFGIIGTAVSVTTARVCGGIMRIIVLFSKKGKLSLTKKDKYEIDKGMMTRVIKVGAPAFIEQVVMQGGFLIMQTIIMSMGTVAAASYQIGVNMNSLAFMPIFGFAITATTMVGQSLGKKEYDKAEEYAYEINKLAMLIISIIGIFMFFLARPLASLYSTDMEVIEASVTIIRIFAVLEPLLAILNVGSSVLRASGDIKYVTITSIVGLWTFRVLSALLLHKFFGLGVYAVMTGVSLDFSVRAAMYMMRIKKGRWKYLKV
jgi:putative MATE family efflux protein